MMVAALYDVRVMFSNQSWCAKPLKTLGDLQKSGLNLSITCRWCGTIRLMLIAEAIEAASKKRGGPFTHVSAFAEEIVCSKCVFKKAVIEPDDRQCAGRPTAAPLKR